MTRKTPTKFIKISTDFIYSFATKEKYRLNKKDFTRNRKLPFEELVLFMLKLLRRTIQLELNSFFKELSGSISASKQKLTSSAFVQSRKKLNPDLFYDLNNLIATEYYIDNDEKVNLNKGLRVLAIDGSTLNLPVTDDTKKFYGTTNNQAKTDDVVLGRVSILYDVLNEIVLDGKLRSLKEGEVPLSHEHFKYLKQGDIVIMDRAYPSFESAYLLQEQGVHFLFRCKANFSTQVKMFYESNQKDQLIEIKPSEHRSFKELPYNKDSRLTVRMIRFVLSSGEVEILMTSLLDKKIYLHKEFKELYFKRWPIETFYDRFKNIIGVEHFSGTSNQFIQQEFNCALYISNMQTILTEDAQLDAAEKYDHRKYEYKINRSLSLGIIRENLIRIYSNKKETKTILEELKEIFVLNVIPIRPNRNNKRDVDKYQRRTKPKQFKNKRSVF